MFERANAAQAIGDNAVARRNYQFVSDVLAESDAGFRSMLQRARAFPGVTGAPIALGLPGRRPTRLASMPGLVHDSPAASSVLTVSAASYQQRRIVR